MVASETQDQAAVSGVSVELPYDTCFGVVEAKASMSSPKESKLDYAPMKVRLSGQGKALGIFDDASSRQIGAIISSTLSDVIKRFTATLKAYNEKGKTSNNNASPNGSMYRRRGLRIVVYGRFAEKEDVSNLLSRGKMFLQHPIPAEYDSRVPYDNSQFFVRPGGSMPKVEDLYVASQNRRTRVVKDALTEVEKAHLLQIFESASDPNVAANISQSPRLSSSLKEHQRSALAMMVEKECGILERSRFPSIWKVEDDGSGKKRFRNAVTNMPEAKPVPVRGGILADAMGLGKTLSVLALLCWHLDTLHDTTTGVSKRTTLLVTPKSIIHEWKQQIRAHTKPNYIEYAVYHGADRKLSVGEWDKKDIVLTTYDTLRSDYASNSPLFRTTWARVVLDEAHNIRNGSS